MQTIITIEKKAEITNIVVFKNPPIDAPFFGQAPQVICYPETTDVIQVEQPNSDITFS